MSEWSFGRCYSGDWMKYCSLLKLCFSVKIIDDAQ